MRAESGPYPVAEIVQACRGTLLAGDLQIAFRAISTDSRDIKDNDLFVPLKGTNFDGHEFLFPALEAGARGSLVDREVNREIYKDLSNHVLIQVQDTLLALSDLASAHRKKCPVPLIAITGSSGKTTVKEMIAAVLRRSHHPLVSQGNFNNMIGLPMTILNLGHHHSVAVVEAGINKSGEMDFLAQAASPNVAVITTIGPVHLEGLGSIEKVAREKFKLVDALPPNGTAIIPARNPYLEPLSRKTSCKLITFGLEYGDFRADNIRYGVETSFEVKSPVGKQEIGLRIPGQHNIANALAAAAACSAAGVPLSDVALALSRFSPPSWRMEILSLGGKRVLIRDCYNANPQSVSAALEVLARLGTGAKTLAILADMAELGDQSAPLHEEMGKEAARLRIDRLVFIGNYGRFFADGYVSAGGDAKSVTPAPDKESAWNIIGPEVENFEIVLVKGSRLMKMETIADRILREN
ncbi:MAG: UDP-N-acetylmuramoyl-tripeptide--D-alanyl-D-alanine ligase [Desulfomonilaceae bacterium]